MKNKHKTVLVKYKDMSAEIDENIAPLIHEIWKADIDTDNSCQANSDEDLIWIEFSTCYDAFSFLNIVVKYDDTFGSMYWRVLQPGVVDAWDFRILPMDWSLHEWLGDDNFIEHEHHGDVTFDFSVSIRFPVKDMPIIEQRMMDHNIKPQPKQ